MSVISFTVSLKPKEAAVIVREHPSANLVHSEVLELDNQTTVCTLIFEKYYFRASNRAALVVIIENTKGVTGVRAIATGSSQGLIFNIDWGAADNFANSIVSLLQNYIIELK